MVLCRREKELNDLQRIPLDIEILSNLRFGSLEIRDTSVTRVTNNFFSQPKRPRGSFCESYTIYGVSDSRIVAFKPPPTPR
jgi:hypothetical protein